MITVALASNCCQTLMGEAFVGFQGIGSVTAQECQSVIARTGKTSMPEVNVRLSQDMRETVEKRVTQLPRSSQVPISSTA